MSLRSESSGKTTVTLHMSHQEVQKEAGLQDLLMQACSGSCLCEEDRVDIDESYISQPDSGDQALEC